MLINHRKQSILVYDIGASLIFQIWVLHKAADVNNLIINQS